MNAEAINRAIMAEKAALKKMLERANKVANISSRRPRRYSMEFNFEPGDLQAQIQNVHIDANTTFLPKSLESSFRVTGQAKNGGQEARVTLGYGMGPGSTTSGVYRQDFFDFFWTISDTSSDREWQNIEQPSVFLMSGSISPMHLPIPSVLRGGSSVEISINPIYNAGSYAGGPTNLGIFDSIREYVLQFSLRGYEVQA